MKKTAIVVVCVLLIVALAVPGVALAKSGQNQGRSKGGQAAAEQGKGRPAATDPEGGMPAKEARKSEASAARQARKDAKAADKKARKEAKAAAKQTAKAEVAAGAVGSELVSEEASGSLEASGSAESTAPTGPGIANAMSRITANLNKSLTKIADGKKKQLPPGLVKVWLKFAAWLGIDPTTRPGYVAPAEPPTAPEPTSTVEPTPTVDPTSTVEPTITVEPTTTVDSGATPPAP